MVILVLLQKSDGDSLSGIGGGSGGMGAVISSKASANFLSKTTMILVAVFMFNCLVLATISNVSKKKIASELEAIVKEQEQINDGTKAPEVK